MMNPLVIGLLSQCRPPKFGGNVEDWQQFRRDWAGYIQILQLTAPGEELPDTLLLQALKQSLDEETQRDLQRRKERDPNLTYAQYWGELQKEFEGDIIGKNRAAWEGVRLQNRDWLTTQDGRKFCTEFELCKHRVEDWSETEEYTLIQKQLSTY